MIEQIVKRESIVAIVGPTASGKTELAIKLAKKFHGVVISADSRQIYKGLPIGTNQPSGRTIKLLGHQALLVSGVPHFFIGQILPSHKYSAAKYQKQVYKLLPQLWQKNLLPILVGGTGLYTSAILENYTFPKGQVDLKTIKQLNKKPTSQLLARLKKVDPATYKTIDKKNRRRIIRALAYFLTTGQSFKQQQNKSPLKNTLILGLNHPRKKLYSQINKRVDKMLKQGLFREMTWLLNQYPQSPALATIGYQELIPVINHQTTLNQAAELIKQHSRNLAKRQITWFKKLPKIKWIKSSAAQTIINNYIKRPKL